MVTNEAATTRAIDVTDVPRRWAEMLSPAADRRMRVIVAENGVPVAAPISIADLERLNARDVRRVTRGDLEGSTDCNIAQDSTAAALVTVESARSLQAERQARRSGEPFPASSNIPDAVREERSDQRRRYASTLP